MKPSGPVFLFVESLFYYWFDFTTGFFHNFLFLSVTVLENNTFLGIYPFPLGYLFFWCITVHSTVMILCIFVISVVTNLLEFQILIIYA